jgi:4-carboxymuconolactone decarboxylase
MDTGRLHWYEPSELDEAQRRVYDAVTGGPRSFGPQVIEREDGEGRLYGPFNAMMIDPAVGEVMQAVGAALRYATDIPGRTREIAILEIAAHHESEFEWYAHSQIARSLGMTEEELEGIRSRGAVPSLSADEAAVRTVATALLARRDLSDAEFAQATGQLGLRLVTDLVYLVGYYESVALSLRVFRVPLPPGFSPVFS